MRFDFQNAFSKGIVFRLINGDFIKIDAKESTYVRNFYEFLVVEKIGVNYKYTLLIINEWADLGYVKLIEEINQGFKIVDNILEIPENSKIFDYVSIYLK